MNIRIWGVVVTAFMLLVSTLAAPAITQAEQMWDKGRARTFVLANQATQSEMAVMSAQAYYDTSKDSGVERIRVWARLENVQAIYPSPWYVVWINATGFRFSSTDSRRDYFYINGVNPPDKTSSHTLDLVLYDILAYLGVPTATIESYVNNFTVSRVETSGFGSYDVSRTFVGAGSSKIDLPASYSYSDADGLVEGETDGSSAQSYFKYDITCPDSKTNFSVTPEARVRYGFSYDGGFPWYWWTGYAGFSHTVNTQ